MDEKTRAKWLRERAHIARLDEARKCATPVQTLNGVGIVNSVGEKYTLVYFPLEGRIKEFENDSITISTWGVR